ncbi:MAG: GNAT family N-acetyltransferase [Bacteroidales bacterium]|nr:GNAT family N-acetyltransferase [Bacteroidales bacterium]
MKNYLIRKIKPEDNALLAKIIREVLTEFGGNRPGTAYYDYDTDHMYEAYQGEGEIYYVVELDGKLVGGSGIKQLAGEDKSICELQKLYILETTRGLGIGKALVEKCIGFAQKAGYQKCYLETFPNMTAAINLYKKFDFKNLDAPLGNTGHGGCDVWLMRDLST